MNYLWLALIVIVFIAIIVITRIYTGDNVATSKLRTPMNQIPSMRRKDFNSIYQPSKNRENPVQIQPTEQIFEQKIIESTDDLKVPELKTSEMKISEQAVPDNVERFHDDEYEQYKNYTDLHRDIHHITDNIYISNVYSAVCPDTLRRHNIAAVVNISNMYYEKHPCIQDIMHIYIDDSPITNIQKYFDKTYEFIEKHTNQRNNVLIHCAAGISRSVSIVIAYLIKKKSMSFQEAFIAVKEKRKIAQPNSGFQDQLKAYSKYLHKK